VRIKTKLISFYLGITLIFSVGGYYGVYFTKHVGEYFAKVESDSVPSLISLMEIIAATRQASIKSMEYSIRGDKDDMNKALEALEKIEQGLLSYKTTMLNQEPARKLNLYEKIDKFEINIKNYLSLGSRDAASPSALNNFNKIEVQLHTTRRDLIHVLYPLIEGEKQEFQHAAEQTRAQIKNAHYVLISTILIVILIALVTGFIISRSITKPILKLNDSAQHIAQGNLEHKTNIDSSDEIGELADSFEHMKHELKVYHDHMEDLVKQRTSALESSNQELEAYSYSISHDLRAPLRSIAGFSQIVLEDASDKLSEEEIGYLQKVVNSSEHMSDLINDILELSRVSRSEIKISDVNLSDICSEISAELSSSNPERNVKWIIQPDIITRCDKRLLFIVLSNLLNNAWKFTIKEPEAVIEFSQVEKSGLKQLIVKDNGIGFNMKYADKIFGLFQRMHKKEEFEGTGVGLATVQRIIHRHNGWVKIESIVNEGTTVSFNLPEDTAG